VKGPDGKDPHATTDEEGGEQDSSEEDEGEVDPYFLSTYLTCARAEIPRCSIVQEGDSRSKRKSVSAPSPDRNRKRARGDAHAEDAAFSEVDINLHYCQKDGKCIYKFNLREVDSIERKMYRRSEEEDKTFTFGVTLTSNIRAVVSLHYFPKLLSKPTRPLDKYEKTLPGEGPMLSIYWQGRWIPYSMVRQLPKALIGTTFQSNHLMDRLRGTIWFPRKMLPSNNKLRLNQCPEEQLNQGEVRLHDLNSNEPRDIKIEWDEDNNRYVQSKFKNWIKKCHEAYDREIKFTEMLPDQQNDADETLFRAVTYGKAIYKVGNTVKLKKGNHFYRITSIICKASPKHAENDKSYSNGQFRAQRLPLTAFGCDANCLEDIEKLSDEQVSEEDLRSYKDKIDEIEAGLPEKLIVANKSKQSRGQVRLNDVKELDTFTLTAGERLPELAVYVQSRGGKAVEKTIDTKKSQSRKLEVTCKITLTATYLEEDKGKLKDLPDPKDCTPWDGTWKCPEPDRGAFVFDASRSADGGESENLHYQAVAPPSPEKLPEMRQFTESFPLLVPAHSACGVGCRLGRTPSPSLSRPFSSLSTQRESPLATRSPRPSPSTLSPLPSPPAVAPTPHPTAPVREASRLRTKNWLHPVGGWREFSNVMKRKTEHAGRLRGAESVRTGAQG